MRFERIKEIYKKLLKYKKSIETLTYLNSATPPSVFISSHNNVIGILAPVNVENVDICDNPPLWYSKRLSIEELLDIRARTIYAKVAKNRFLDILKEISLSTKPVDVEMKFSKKPRFLMIFDLYHKPIGNPTLVEDLNYNNIKTKKIIEKVIEDDIKACDAIVSLYERNIPIYTIQRIFSLGLLGRKMQRKIVPTRYSITTVDSIISEYLLKYIKHYNIIDNILLFENNYLGNHYYILLLPNAWEYELIEIIYRNGLISEVYCDYESYKSRKSYPENTAGGYYAAKLAVLEYLNKRKRQASVIIFRKIFKEESLALGVWKVREACKNAFNNKPKKFESLKDLIEFLKKHFRKEILLKSKILRKNMYQRRLTFKNF